MNAVHSRGQRQIGALKSFVVALVNQFDFAVYAMLGKLLDHPIAVCLGLFHPPADVVAKLLLDGVVTKVFGRSALTRWIRRVSQASEIPSGIMNQMQCVGMPYIIIFQVLSSHSK